MNDLLDLVVETDASDLHIHVGEAPTLRVGGEMTPVDGPVLEAADTEQLMLSITGVPLALPSVSSSAPSFSQR